MTDILRFVRVVVTVVSLTLWTVMGFLLWVPLLMRMTSYFTAMVVADSFVRGVDMQQVQKRLDFAIEFYVYGYRRILALLAADHREAVPLRGLEPVPIRGFARYVLLDILWTVLFWAGLCGMFRLW